MLANHFSRGTAVNITYFTLCVRACVRARARDCVHARIWVPGSLGVSMSVSVCSIAYPACNSYAPYCDAFLAPPDFSKISYKRYDFRKSY
jgi:hypothetical protein